MPTLRIEVLKHLDHKSLEPNMFILYNWFVSFLFIYARSTHINPTYKWVLILHKFFATQKYHLFWYTKYYCIYSLLHKISPSLKLIYVLFFSWIESLYTCRKRSCPINYVSHCFTSKIQRNRIEVLKEMRILHGAKNIFDSKHTRP